jgi:hypothetical protein
VSADEEALKRIEAIIDGGSDADEVLRQVVALLQERYAWVGISFVEEGELAQGPEQGERHTEATGIPISYENHVVGQLSVVADTLGADETEFLQQVATLIAPYCLVGWDTGGEPWTP